MMRTGGCLCGKVRYRLKGDLGNIVDCHCLDCRRSSGAPYVTWATIARSDLDVTQGALQAVAYADRLRLFAPCCGTQIIFQENAAAEWIDVTIASLDDPGAFRPVKALWLEDHLPWVPLNPQVPGFQQRTVVAK